MVTYWSTIIQSSILTNSSPLQVKCHSFFWIGRVLKAPTFHQCGPGSIPELSTKCGLNLLGSVLCSERFFPRYSSPFDYPYKLLFSHLTLTSFRTDASPRIVFNAFACSSSISPAVCGLSRDRKMV